MMNRTRIVSAVLTSLFVVALAPRSASAEEPSYTHAPVTLWLAPMVGVGGTGSKVTTNVALSLGVSGYSRLEGVDVGVVGSWVSESARGVQITSGFNYVGADLIGAQITAGVNVTRERVIGGQVAALFNFAGADVFGLQVASLANVARKEVRGVQVSSVFNYSPDVKGGQIGVVNVAGEVSGLQIGLVNVARNVKGPQIGLLNVAEDSDAPIGLINLVENGQRHFDVWTSDSASVNVGVKLGGKYVYSVLAAGFNAAGKSQRWMAGLGIGGHLPIGDRFFADTDLIHWSFNDGLTFTYATNSITSLRLVGGFSVHRHFTLFAGPTLNLLVSDVNHADQFGMVPATRLSAEGSTRTILLWPGFVAGVQI